MEDNHYVCTAKDCNLRFSSEDSLQLHRKRHGMVLSLNKNNVPSSDQTPTPVRFIRQCEEIGLFQDLMNPFEETFRKAAEAVKKGATPKNQNLPILGTSTNEDLHTPNIFPDEIGIGNNNIDSKNEKSKHLEEEVVVRSEADTSLRERERINTSHHLSPVSNDRVSTTSRGCLVEGFPNEDPLRVTTTPAFTTTLIPENTFTDSTDPVQVLLRMPNGSLVQLATKPVTTPLVPLNVTPSPIQLEETVKVVPRSYTTGGTVILATNGLPPDLPPSQQLSTKDVKQKLKQLLGSTSKTMKKPISLHNKTNSLVNKGDGPSKKESRIENDNQLDEVEKERRSKILERNRKAAIRCRERRKRWVEDLCKHADSMVVTNRRLNDEILSLKAEVANLRTLLLAHANCPLTLAQSSFQGSGGPPVERIELGTKRPRRECLTLDIEQAKKAAAIPVVELDTPTPTIVKNDKILSSVAPPATPEQDRLVTFTEILPQVPTSEINEEIIDERQHLVSASISGGTTTVIQINPNAIRPSHSFS